MNVIWHSNSEWAQLTTNRHHSVFNPTHTHWNRYLQCNNTKNTNCVLSPWRWWIWKGEQRKAYLQTQNKSCRYSLLSALVVRAPALCIPISWNIECLQAEMRCIRPISDMRCVMYRSALSRCERAKDRQQRFSAPATNAGIKIHHLLIQHSL